MLTRTRKVLSISSTIKSSTVVGSRLTLLKIKIEVVAVAVAVAAEITATTVETAADTEAAAAAAADMAAANLAADMAAADMAADLAAADMMPATLAIDGGAQSGGDYGSDAAVSADCHILLLHHVAMTYLRSAPTTVPSQIVLPIAPSPFPLNQSTPDSKMSEIHGLDPFFPPH